MSSSRGPSRPRDRTRLLCPLLSQGDSHVTGSLLSVFLTPEPSPVMLCLSVHWSLHSPTRASSKCILKNTAETSVHRSTAILSWIWTPLRSPPLETGSLISSQGIPEWKAHSLTSQGSLSSGEPWEVVSTVHRLLCFLRADSSGGREGPPANTGAPPAVPAATVHTVTGASSRTAQLADYFQFLLFS